ncbi:uncharacterized protein DS421_16g554220 [Arachis hypogaea]|nr:uncharacterized protein DS421_16g554220 [Arachis hypogaea]
MKKKEKTLFYPSSFFLLMSSCSPNLGIASFFLLTLLVFLSCFFYLDYRGLRSWKTTLLLLLLPLLFHWFSFSLKRAINAMFMMVTRFGMNPTLSTTLPIAPFLIKVFDALRMEDLIPKGEILLIKSSVCVLFFNRSWFCFYGYNRIPHVRSKRSITSNTEPANRQIKLKSSNIHNIGQSNIEVCFDDNTYHQCFEKFASKKVQE